MDIWTQMQTEVLEIVPEDQVFRMSITAQGGDILVTGGWEFKNTPSAPMTVKDGGTVVLVANPNRAMKVTVDPSGNTAAVMVFFN